MPGGNGGKAYDRKGGPTLAVKRMFDRAISNRGLKACYTSRLQRAPRSYYDLNQ